MNKLLIFGLPVVAVAAFVVAPKVSAADRVMYSSMPGARTSIPITRKASNVGGKVNATFKYELVEKEGNPARVRGLQTNTTITVQDGSAKSNGVWSSNCSLYLGNMSFEKVGDYAFELSETYVSDEENYPRDTNKYEIYFHVTNVLDENNSPTGALNIQLADYLYSEKADGKVGLDEEIFESGANFTHISLENKVTGGAADAGKYFKYQIAFDGISEGSVLTVSGQDASVDYGGEAVETVGEYTVGSDALMVYLKHGQTVTVGEHMNRDAAINELPQGTSYTITKLDSDDRYTVSIDDQSVSTVTKAVAKLGSEDYIAHNTTVAGNNKEAVVNTGVVLNILPFLTAAMAGVGGLFVYRRMTRR